MCLVLSLPFSQVLLLHLLLLPFQAPRRWRALLSQLLSRRTYHHPSLPGLVCLNLTPHRSSSPQVVRITVHAHTVSCSSILIVYMYCIIPSNGHHSNKTSVNFTQKTVLYAIIFAVIWQRGRVFDSFFKQYWYMYVSVTLSRPVHLSCAKLAFLILHVHCTFTYVEVEFSSLVRNYDE